VVSQQVLYRTGRIFDSHHHPRNGVILLRRAVFQLVLSAHVIGGGRVGGSARAGEVCGQHARSIPIIRKRPAFKDRPSAVGIAFCNAGGAVLGIVGVGVDDSALDAAGHIPIGIILIRVRRSRFGADTGHGVRDGRAVGVRPREPACRVRRLRIVHAGVG